MPRIWIHSWVLRLQTWFAEPAVAPPAALSELPTDGYVSVAALPRAWIGDYQDRIVEGVSFGTPPPPPPAPPPVSRLLWMR